MHVYQFTHLFLKYHCWEISIFFKYLFLYFFGCLRSWLHHVGSFLVDSLAVVHRLSCSILRILWDLMVLYDLSFLTRFQTHIPCIPRRIRNHWTTREVPEISIFQFSWTLPHDMSLQVNVTKQDTFCAQEGENTYIYYRNTYTYFRRRVVSFKSRYYVPVSSR